MLDHELVPNNEPVIDPDTFKAVYTGPKAARTGNLGDYDEYVAQQTKAGKKPVDFDQCDDCGGYYKVDDLVIERTGYKTCLNCVEREVQKTEENDKRILAAIAEGETRVVLH